MVKKMEGDLSKQQFPANLSDTHFVDCFGEGVCYGQEGQTRTFSNLHWQMKRGGSLSDLTYAEGSHLKDFSFTAGKLEKVVFNKVTLKKGKFVSVVFKKSCANYSTFSEVKFLSCTLEELDFSGNDENYTIFEHGSFEKPTLKKVNMFYARLTKISFEQPVHIKEINFSYATLTNVKGLNQEDLNGVNFTFTIAVGEEIKPMLKQKRKGRKQELAELAKGERKKITACDKDVDAIDGEKIQLIINARAREGGQAEAEGIRLVGAIYEGGAVPPPGYTPPTPQLTQDVISLLARMNVGAEGEGSQAKAIGITITPMIVRGPPQVTSSSKALAFSPTAFLSNANMATDDEKELVPEKGA